jgi:hypothetical protein
MNVAKFNESVTADSAKAALAEYRKNRDIHDEIDQEIERIYRRIAKGQSVISVNQAIVNAGLDATGRPRLAICRADGEFCICQMRGERLIFSIERNYRDIACVRVPWPGLMSWQRIHARVPRIPPQYRPTPKSLIRYHILWEADWQDYPKDPYLLRRIGRDAWVVLAAWDLTEVELSVLRAHEGDG